ncbi:MAG: A/G-specific adenine glycosylase [Planctomycetota bacterium]
MARSIGRIPASRAKLLAWYRRRRRDLPWRRRGDAYAIWVSEIMLQQTRVAAVIPYYERFLCRFPDVGTLARARENTVLAHWSGLGYYRRARFLHAAARVVVREGVPQTAEGWRALPGVGEYTAAAVASIAFGEPIAVVDGNVERVLSRMHRIESDKRAVKAAAQAWVSRRSPGDHNQAVMELGATVCTPRAPRCDRCPVRAFCGGQAEPDRYPAPRARPKTVRKRRSVAFVVRAGKVKLVRNDQGTLLRGMWRLPDAEPGEAKDSVLLGRVAHSVLHKRITLSIYGGPASEPGQWFGPKKAAALPLTAAARKCLKQVGFFPIAG